MNTTTRKFGIRMEGLEEPFEELIRDSILDRDLKDSDVASMTYLYVEIGVASGDTLRSVTEIIRDAAPPWMQWATIGLDLPDGYALDRNGVKERMPDLHTGPFIMLKRPNLILRNSQDALRVEPRDGGAALFKKESIDIGFVDGCHGKACVKADFECLEPLIVPGGYVVFHDAGEADQGGDYQPHCKEGINVRAALKELDLLPCGYGEAARRVAGCSRAGWSWVSEWVGDKSRGGNSAVVVRKVIP